MYPLIMSPEMMLGKTKARAAMSFDDHNDDYLQTPSMAMLQQHTQSPLIDKITEHKFNVKNITGAQMDFFLYFIFRTGKILI